MGFDERAKSWDASRRRQVLASSVAGAIREKVGLKPDMRILDMGAGTGLLTEHLLPFVGHVTAVDTSKGMLEKFTRKFAPESRKIDTFHGDILEFEASAPYDGIVSSMTMHHIEDLGALFHKLHTLLKPGGFIAIADLTPEDGTFHDHGNDGVHHFGFEEGELRSLLSGPGFMAASIDMVHTILKGKRRYDIFLLTARKPPCP
ncbi:methyltransferase domain-containing protein [Hydrogenimonas sp. SS33]|uniref:class I SAM-dependent DNA methyltransferase n=1 Tax=Hydrogenimonas leucolamina TaxID=2954236 RepID=UPI00336BE156